MTLRYGSVCSGIEAATVAWEPLGWKAQWFSEIEPFACSVLRHRFPNVANRGDMTRYKEWPYDGRTALDVLIGGTPCQSFSLAGLRKGLDDPRGNLALVFLGLAERFSPRWILWENVDGVLSAGGGRDFGSFLGALGQLGYGWAYRVLDAKHFGVAQQRRRVFVCAHKRGGWQRPASVLFDKESICGDLVAGRQLDEGIATGSTGRTDGPILLDRAAFNQGINAQFEPRIGPAEFSPTLIRRGPHALLDPISGRVRRMTALEGERLQGFPDGWTDVQHEGAEPTFYQRWQAIGNSMAVPVIRYLGQRIQTLEESGHATRP